MKSSNSAKALAKKKAAQRTDAAGRSGMGETASSNIYDFKASKTRPGNRAPVSSASLSASAAYNKAEATKKPTARRGETGRAAFEESMAGAQAYARKRKQEMENLKRYPK